MGRHLGALLRADALGALGGQGAHQPQDPGGEDHAQDDHRHDHREQHVPGRRQGAGGLEERKAGSDHQRGAQSGARRDHDALASDLPRLLLGLAPGGPGPGGDRRLGGAGHGRLTPQQRAAGAHQHHRPDDGVGEPDAQLAQRQQRTQEQEACAHGDLHGPAAPGQPPRPRDALAHGDRHPGQRVDGHAQASRRSRHHEGQAYEQGVDAHARGDSGAHPSEQAVRWIASQRRVRRRRARDGSGCHGGVHDRSAAAALSRRGG